MNDEGKDDGLSEDGRRTVLVVAIVLTMVFVVGAWLWLLPAQLDISSGAGDDQADWKLMHDSLDDESVDFRKSLDALSSSLNEVSQIQSSGDPVDGDSSGGDAGPPDTAAIVDRLQERLGITQTGTGEEDQK